jgi:hypothetical protein
MRFFRERLGAARKHGARYDGSDVTGTGVR